MSVFLWVTMILLITGSEFNWSVFSGTLFLIEDQKNSIANRSEIFGINWFWSSFQTDRIAFKYFWGAIKAVVALYKGFQRLILCSGKFVWFVSFVLQISLLQQTHVSEFHPYLLANVELLIWCHIIIKIYWCGLPNEKSEKKRRFVRSRLSMFLRMDFWGLISSFSTNFTQLLLVAIFLPV